MKAIFVLIVLVSKVIAFEEKLLHYVVDQVEAGSYKYYTLMHDGSIKIKLISNSGDADLYISLTNTKPTYEPDHYWLQSTTCGEDIVDIFDNFKRPISVGVYGHPSHPTSQYTLSIHEQTPVGSDATHVNQDQRITFTKSVALHILGLFLKLFL